MIRFNPLLSLVLGLAMFAGLANWALAASGPLDAVQAKPVVHVVYFNSVTCPHCQAVEEQVLKPLQAQYGAQLDVRMVEISSPSNYELLIRTEERFAVRAEQRGIPTLVIGDTILIGEEAIRAQFPGLVEQGLALGGIALPNIAGMETLQPGNATGSGLGASCQQTQTLSCDSAKPIWVAYFYQVGCQKCSRAEADIQYVRSRQTQLVIDQFNIYEHPALAQWLAERAGRKEVSTPAVFVGDAALIGEAEITPQNLKALANRYAADGAPRLWADFEKANGPGGGLLEQFRALGPLTVVFAGLVDGLNPCAFATLIFLVSYLTFSERRGREVLAVGGAFAFGVFLAYLGVGLGFYKVLDLLGGTLTTLSRWVYALTALMCAGLAVISFLDFLKARRGEIGEMSLKLPAVLRRRVNAVVRSGQHARAFILGAFVTGVVVSLIELACTGQIYLPTIIFVVSIPELRVQALSYLLLYNLVFVLPLVVVFVLVYYGTTSHQLGRFLQQNTARVKLGAVILFASLATWLGMSLIL